MQPMACLSLLCWLQTHRSPSYRYLCAAGQPLYPDCETEEGAEGSGQQLGKGHFNKLEQKCSRVRIEIF